MTPNATSLKVGLLDLCAASLIKEPKFDLTKESSRTVRIVTMAKTLAKTCPEYILKLALYVRLDLNIRVTANLLSAVAATTPLCMPYLKAYIPKIIVLPSDWVQIAQMSQDIIHRHRLQHEAINEGTSQLKFHDGVRFNSTVPPLMKGLPTALRGALVERFAGFDEYQLAKHDKERAMLNRNRRNKKKGTTADKTESSDSDTDSDADSDASSDEEEEEEEVDTIPTITKERVVFTIKRLIRYLHITKPVYHVMCITGRKYPTTKAGFEDAGLTGDFEESRAGKRMKLATPKTWEVVVSAEGNKAGVWEGLLDASPPLPFMAMLRNLRNFLLSGISEEHHAKVLNRLRSADQVLASRQFPHQFFNAYTAVSLDLETAFLTYEEKQAVYLSRGSRMVLEPWMQRRKVPSPVNPPTESLLDKYREAIDEASRLATVFNVNPIRGKTVVFCDVLEVRPKKGHSAVGGVKQPHGIGMLLSLLFQYGSEDCEIRLYDSETGENRAAPRPHSTQILANMAALDAVVADMQETATRRGTPSALRFPFDVLNRYLREERHIDNLIVISSTFVGGAGSVRADNKDDANPYRTGGVKEYLEKIRRLINPDLLYVSVDIAGRNSAKARNIVETSCHMDKEAARDVYIVGFSDNILRFVSERGGSQMDYVDRIDEAKGVKKQLINFETLQSRLRLANPDIAAINHDAASEDDDDDDDDDSDSEGYDSSTDYTSTTNVTASERRGKSVTQSVGASRSASKVSTLTGGWRTIRVFVSSTFLDMQTERNILASKVFPTLRRWCAVEGIKAHIEDVDFRWGITQTEAEKGLSPSICLSHVEACKPFFLGLVGARYGAMVPAYDQIKPDPEILAGASAHCMHWLSEMPANRSLTELEMMQGALGVDPAEHAFFYLRDNEALVKTVPQVYQHIFESETPEKARLVEDLRANILRKGASGDVTARHYNAECSANSAELTGAGLDSFEQQVTLDLWKAILKEFKGEDEEDSDAEEVEDSQFLVEREGHHNFLAKKAGRFCGRRGLMSGIYNWVQGCGDGTAATTAVATNFQAFQPDVKVKRIDPNVFLLLGDEGTGKSSVAAALCKRLQWQTEAILGDETIVIPHFVGCTPASRHPDAVLLRLITELRILVGDADDAGVLQEGETEPRSLAEIYTALLAKVETVTKVIIVIDGIDKMEPQEAALKVFATLIPSRRHRAQTRFFLTSTPRSWCHLALLKRSPPPETKHFSDLPLSERKEIFKKTMKLYGKAVEESYSRKGGAVIQTLVKKSDAKVPEYLAIVMEYLRIHATHDTLAGMVRDIPATLPKLLDYLLQQTHTRFGLDKNCAASVLPPLALSHGSSLGLSLAQLQEYSGLGAYQVLSLLAVLPDHLVTYDPALGAYRLVSGVFAMAVKKAFCRNKAEEMSVRRRLSQLLLRPALVEKPDAKAKYAFHLLKESDVRNILKHALAGQHWELLEELLSDLVFIETCARMNLVYDLLTVIDECLRTNKLLARRLGAFRTFLSENLHLLDSYPMIVHQCAMNAVPDESGVGVQSAAKRLAESDGAHVAWFQQVAQQMSPPLCTRDQKMASAVCCVAMSKDSRYVAAGCADWSIRVHTQRDGSHKFTLKRHTDTVTAIAFSMSDTMVSCSRDKSFVLWSLQDGAVLWHKHNAHFKAVNGVFVAKSGDCIVSGGDDGRVNIWDIPSKARVTQLNHHTGPVTCVKAHSEGRLFASASWDRTVRLYVSPGPEARCIGTIQTRLKAIRDISWIPSLTQVIACSSVDGKVKVFDVMTREVMTTYDSHYGRAVNSVTYSNDGKFLATSDTAGCIKVWRAGITEQHIVTCNGHFDGVAQTVFAPDNRTLISGSADGHMKSWHRERAPMQSIHQAKVTACVLYGETVVTAGRDGAIKVSHAASEKLAQRFIHHTDDNIDNPHVAVTCLDLSEDGQRILAGCADGGIRIWLVDSMATPETSRRVPVVSLRAHRNVVTGAKWVSSDEFVTVSWDCSIKRWGLTVRLSKNFDDIQEVSEAKALQVQRKAAHRREITSVEVSGDTLTTASFDGTVRVWNAETLTPIRTLLHGTSWTVACAYHPADPALLASVSYDGTLCLWDLSVPSADALLVSHNETDQLSSVAFLSNNLLVTGGTTGLRAYRINLTLDKTTDRVVSEAVPLSGVYFTKAPIASLAVSRQPRPFAAGRKRGVEKEDRLVYCGDVLGGGGYLSYHDVEGGAWGAVRRGEEGVPKEALLEGAVVVDCNASSVDETASSLESYSTWETADPNDVYPGRGGLFKKFASGEERKQHLLSARNEYIASLKNRGKPKEKKTPMKPMSADAQQHFEQSVCIAQLKIILRW